MGFFEDSFLLSASEADLHRRMKLSAVLRHIKTRPAAIWMRWATHMKN